MFILAGGFDRASAEAALKAGEADLIAFARPFLANPDLQRMRTDAPLNDADMATFYNPRPQGLHRLPGPGGLTGGHGALTITVTPPRSSSP